MSRVAVIGAGPAGLTAAYRIAERESNLDVYEAAPTVGGLARSMQLWGQTVDIGPHRFFSTDPRVNSLWLEVAHGDYSMVDRMTRIYYRRKFFHYPIRPLQALALLGPWEACRCLFSYLQQKVHPTRLDGTFENWVVSRFGRRLFEIFFKTYSEKLWGLSCRELDSDFAAQRIKKLSLWEALMHSLRRSRQVRHKTLVEQFAYPHEGSGMIYQRMAEAVTRRGGRVHLQSPVERVLTRDGAAYALELRGGEIREYDRIISSMPLTLLVQRLPEVPEGVLACARRLRFRNTILVYLKIGAERVFPDNWLYLHDPDIGMGRITNFRNWVPQLYGQSSDSILAAEYWCNFSDPEWNRSDGQWAELARRELATTGLLQGAPVLDTHVVRVPRCYPIYDRGYKDLLAPIQSYLAGVANLQVIGRYGAFKYNNQDHSILMGLLAADNVLTGATNDLWQINSDYEVYQEGSRITSTGLVRDGA